MRRNPASGEVVFTCKSCLTEEKGDAADARISGAVHGAAETTEMYRRLIETAPFDRTNLVVRRDCPVCGLDYAVQIRVGDAEVVIYKCKCNYESFGHA
jgi:hypothetical protein